MSTGNDYIDNERHRKPARKVQGDQRPTAHRRKHPPKPQRVYSWSKLATLQQKYQGLAAKYSQLAQEARAADWDDVEMGGSSRSEPMPSETVYTLMSDLARMFVRDLKEEGKE